MTRTVKTAADMPPGTEVETTGHLWVKSRPGDEQPWFSEADGTVATDFRIDEVLAAGGVITHIPSSPGRWSTRYMPTGTVITFEGGSARKERSSYYDPFPWLAFPEGTRMGDEWVQQRIADGATITYPDGR